VSVAPSLLPRTRRFRLIRRWGDDATDTTIEVAFHDLVDPGVLLQAGGDSVDIWEIEPLP
jgi:hypothetical protein